MTPKHEQSMPPEFCNHANEVPAVCTCPPTCYCKTHTCLKRIEVTEIGAIAPPGEGDFVIGLERMNPPQGFRKILGFPPSDTERIFVLVAVDLDRKEIDKLNHKRLIHMGHKIPVSDFDMVENTIVESMQHNHCYTKIKVFKVDLDV